MPKVFWEPNFGRILSAAITETILIAAMIWGLSAQSAIDRRADAYLERANDPKALFRFTSGMPLAEELAAVIRRSIA